MIAVYVVLGIIALALLMALTPSKPMVSNVSSPEEILEIAKTNKIQAIKECRAMYGFGLKDAKDVVEKMLRENSAEFLTSSDSEESDEKKIDEIKSLLKSGNKIEAIKQYRALYGVGLKDAKEAVENMS